MKVLIYFLLSASIFQLNVVTSSHAAVKQPFQPPGTEGDNTTTISPPTTTQTTPKTTTSTPTPTPTTTSTTAPPTSPPTTTPTTQTPPNSTTPAPITTPSTTPAPTTTPTQPPTAAPTSKPEPDRKFDGPSFIGGIVFTLGLTVIGFISWKFYQARTGPNYHIL